MDDNSCSRCSSAVSSRSLPRIYWGAGAKPGEVRSAEFTSINQPLLNLTRQSLGSIRTHNSILDGVGKPRRPCVVLEAEPGTELVCLLCTFQGAVPPDVFRPFLIPVLTIGKERPSGDHIHSSPEWKHKDNHQQWLLAVPFAPLVEDLMELDGWSSAALPTGVFFDAEALAQIRVRSWETTEMWLDERKLNTAFAQDVKKYILEWETKTIANSRRSKHTHKTRPRSMATVPSGHRQSMTSAVSCGTQNVPYARASKQPLSITEAPAAAAVTSASAPRTTSKLRRTLGAISDNFSLYSNSSARSARSKHALKTPPALGAGTGARTNAFSVLAMDTVQE
uniref:Uncharacterized protein n=1 Tax=Mycena chlorophos TaxID=658473 RepID=A0ABQ0M674_MYCCL|nr:predicted protein [Mycena chlorophos]